MDSIKRALFYFLLVGMVITAVSCQRNESETTKETISNAAQSEVQTTISFAVSGFKREFYEEQAKLFSESHPDIKVEILTTDDLGIVVSKQAYHDEAVLLKLVQSADAIAWTFYPDSVQDGYLLDLEPLMAVDESFAAADFYPGMLERFQSNGGTWGLQMNASYMLVYYDKDLFDKAGVAYPEAGWSWDDLLATAQAVTLREGEDVTQWGITIEYIDPVDLIQAKVGPIFDNETASPTARLQDPDVVSAYQWLADLYTVQGVAPIVSAPDANLARQEAYALIQKGEVAMWMDSFESYDWHAEDRNLGIVPFPISDANMNSSPTTAFGGTVLGISAGTAHPDAAWTWINYLTTQNSNQYIAGSDTLPARQSAAESSGAWEQLDPELAAATRFAIDHAFVPDYAFVASEEVAAILSTMIAEERTAVSVLAEVQQAFAAEASVLASQADAMESMPAFAVAEPPSAQAEDATVVRFVTITNNTTHYQKLAEQFNELQSDIVVKVERPDYSSGDFSPQATVGDADAFHAYRALNSPEELAFVLPLQPLLNADNEINEEDFFPAALNLFQVEGQVMGLPGEIQVQFLNYNKRLFDAADVPYPEPGWTMDDFLQTAVSLTEGDDENEKVYGYMSELYDVNELFIYLALQDAPLIDTTIDPPMANLMDPKVVSVLRWYSDLTTEYEVKHTFEGDPFASGRNPYVHRVALMKNDRVAIFKAEQNEGFYYDTIGSLISQDEHAHIGVVPYPGGAEGTAPFKAVNGYYITADTEVREAAWEWLKYLTTQETIAEYGLPARIATAESEAFRQRVGDEKASLLLDAASHAPQSSQYDDLGASWLAPAVMMGLDYAYQGVISGELTVDEALQFVQNQADVYRQCVIDNDLVDAPDVEGLYACMLEAELNVDSEVLQFLLSFT